MSVTVRQGDGWRPALCHQRCVCVFVAADQKRSRYRHRCVSSLVLSQHSCVFVLHILTEWLSLPVFRRQSHRRVSGRRRRWETLQVSSLSWAQDILSEEWMEICREKKHCCITCHRAPNTRGQKKTTALVFVFKVVKYNKYFTINKGNGLVLTRVKLKLS